MPEIHVVVATVIWQCSSNTVVFPPGQIRQRKGRRVRRLATSDTCVLPDTAEHMTRLGNQNYCRIMSATASVRMRGYPLKWWLARGCTLVLTRHEFVIDETVSRNHWKMIVTHFLKHQCSPPHCMSAAAFCVPNRVCLLVFHESFGIWSKKKCWNVSGCIYLNETTWKNRKFSGKILCN